jgi:hypothetical protein
MPSPGWASTESTVLLTTKLARRARRSRASGLGRNFPRCRLTAGTVDLTRREWRVLIDSTLVSGPIGKRRCSSHSTTRLNALDRPFVRRVSRCRCCSLENLRRGDPGGWGLVPETPARRPRTGVWKTRPQPPGPKPPRLSTARACVRTSSRVPPSDSSGRATPSRASVVGWDTPHLLIREPGVKWDRLRPFFADFSRTGMARVPR